MNPLGKTGCSDTSLRPEESSIFPKGFKGDYLKEDQVGMIPLGESEKLPLDESDFGEV